MKVLLFSLFFFATNILLAQKVVTGIVTDSHGKQMQGSEVSVVDTDVKTMTDSDGKYKIVVPEGFVILKIEKKNYQPKEIVINTDSINVFLVSIFESLNFGVEDLMNIKVCSATYTNKKINEAPATITVITKEMILDRGYETLEDVLRDLPSVDLQRLNGWYGCFFAQRGFIGDENKRTVLMVNGVVENMQWGSEVFTGYNLPLYNVERIEVVFGPASALYGANAFSGIINVITESASKKEYTRALIGGGSYETTFSGFDLARNLTTDLNLKIAANMYDSDGPKFENNYDPNYSSAYVDKAYSIDVQVCHKKTSFLLRHYDAPSGIGNCQASPYKYLYQNQGIATVPDSLRGLGSGNTILSMIYGEQGARFPISGTTARLKHEYSPVKDLKLSVLFYYRTSSLQTDHYDYLYKVRTRANALDPSKYDSSFFDKTNSWVYSKGSGLDFRAVYDKVYLTSVVGATIDYNDVPIDYTKEVHTTYNGVLEATTPAIDARRVLYRNIGGYAEFLLPIRKRIEVVFGSRYDINSQYGDVFTPRLGLVFMFPYNLTMKLLYGEAFRAPTAREMYSTGIGHGARISNPDLKPEKMKSYEAVLSYNLNKIGSLELAGFRNFATDVIFSNVDNGKGNTQNVNMGEMNIGGVEAKLSLSPMRNLLVFGMFTYQKGEQTFLAKKSSSVYDPIVVDTVISEYTSKIPNIAQVKWSIGADCHFLKRFNLSLILNAVGARSTIFTNPLRSVDGYMLANVNISFKATRFILLSLKVKNVLDTENYDPGVRVANETAVLSQIEQAGRAFFFKISINL